MRELSRRGFLRTAVLAFGAAVASSSVGFARRASAAVVRRTTALASIVRAPADPSGYAKLIDGPPIVHVVRTDLGVEPSPDRESCREAILGFVQFSDIHIVDHQSPLRLEWLDRFEDPASIPGTGLLTSCYRPHEMLTAQVSDSMVRAVNDLDGTPVLDLPVAFVIETGDNSDNSQYNEIRWNIDVLDGGPVRPDSGNYAKYEGVMYGKDPNYWHPHGEIATDHARDQGFPTVPGLLDKARAPFEAVGLNVPWYTVFGNHDGLIQGNFPTGLSLNAIATGPLKIMTAPPGFSQANVDALLKTRNLAAILNPILATTGAAAFVKPDTERRILNRAQVIREYFNTSGEPVGHGFNAVNQLKGTAYYYVDHGPVRIIAMDTVNVNGYADGSLDSPQFKWLQQVIDNSAGRLVIVFSHHTSKTMTNPLVVTGGDTNLRVLGGKLVSYLQSKPQVIAWVNGHTHRNEITAHPGGARGFWEINTASHIDYPQQARIIELADNADGTLSIFTTILDHAAPAEVDDDLDSPVALASLSRELSANDYQLADDHLEGTPADTNTELIIKAPPGFAGSAACVTPEESSSETPPPAAEPKKSLLGGLLGGGSGGGLLGGLKLKLF